MLPPSSITVQALFKSFREGGGPLGWLRPAATASRVAVLKNINLEIRPGEVVGLVGPNGAGKTTLLKILATLILPDQGTAQVGGFDVARQAQEVRRGVGVMLELDRSFYARLSGRANLEFFAALHGFSASKARQRTMELLELVGLGEAAGRQAMKYSLGMQHRLGLARALLHDPPVLLLDEPLRTLDPITTLDLGRLLREELAQRRGKTILLASHSLADVERLCDRMAVLQQGEIVALGSREELARRFQAATLEDIYRKAVGRG